MFISSLRTSAILFLLMTILLGVVYPAIVTGILQGVFPAQANGSLITDKDGKIIGSSLIGQQFNDPKYFWGRLSATSPVPYNAAASSGSNLGAANPNLEAAVKGRIDALKETATSNQSGKIPVDLVTASGSGLDPEISPAAALYQVPRVAKLRGMSEKVLSALVKKHTEGRFLGLFGEKRVNVLSLNLAMDDQK